MERLLQTVREAASRGVWSSGVELARSDAVVRERTEPSEVVLRVSGSGVVSPTVVLYPEDGEWECDCGSSDDPCIHVAASVIALRRVEREGGQLPAAGARGARVGYRLERLGNGLGLERVLVQGQSEQRLETTLVALTTGRVDGPEVTADAADLAAERTLGAKRSGRLARGVLHGLLRVLEGHPDVRLDGRPVRCRAEPVGLCARLADDGAGFRLRVERDPAPSELLGDSVGLFGDELRPLAATGLTGRELEDLTRGRHLAPEQLTELVTELLPSLRERMEVRVETKRLPASRAEPPRLELLAEREADDLSVMATLVYGDPPLARVDAGRLVPLGESVPLRDLDAEERLVRELRSRLGLKPGQRVALRDEEALAFAERVAGGWPGSVRGRGLESFFRAPALRPRLEVGEADLRVHFETRAPGDGSPRAAAAGSVLRAWQEGRSLVPLDGGGFAPLPDDWLARHGRQVADLLAAREAAGALPRAALPELARLCDALGQSRPAAFASLARLLDDFESLPAVTLPEDCSASLRPYQETGVRWLCFLRDAGLGALLADDMGLGKTLQTLCALRGRTLVVAPTSVVPNWLDEIGRFRPGLRACLYHGAGRQLDPDADVVLTSYALLRLDRERLAQERFDAVVLDEAQTIKNPDSQVAQAACALQAGFRVALTGTPVENRLEELWSQLHFTNPGLLGARRDFAERVARPVAAGDAAAAAALRTRLTPFVLRRRKADVAPELPPRQELVLRVPLDESERALYDAVRAASVPEVVARLRAGGGVMPALEALLRLRQVCCHPGLLPGQEAERSSKLDLLRDRLETLVADGHRALVFSQWTSLLDRVEPELRSAGIGFGRLDGSTRDRRAVVSGFQSEDGPPVLLLSLKAGGAGLNLTAADHVFLLDPWWNPAVEDQAADRTHRIGQTRPVLVHRLVARDTVEERMLALQAGKRSLAEAALSEGDAAAALTRDDLLAILD